MIPKRIKRERKKGWKKPDNTIYVGRGSKWGNPFRVGNYYKNSTLLFWIRYLKTVEEIVNFIETDGLLIETPEHAVKMYEMYYEKYKINPGNVIGLDISKLKGKNLMCWCSLDKVCHADFLLKKANGKL